MRSPHRRSTAGGRLLFPARACGQWNAMQPNAQRGRSKTWVLYEYLLQFPAIGAGAYVTTVSGDRGMPLATEHKERIMGISGYWSTALRWTGATGEENGFTVNKSGVWKSATLSETPIHVFC